MSNVFLIAKSQKFQSTDFSFSMQGDLLEESEGDPETYIKLSEESFHKDLDRYKCHHDYKHNKHGRVFHKDFSYYYEPIDFSTYYSSSDKLTLVQVKTDVGLDFIKQLNQSGEYSIEPVDMKFEKMIPHILEIKGAWISDLKDAHLKTAGYFGPNVNLSDEYIESAKEGNISSMVIQFTSSSDKKEYTITISRKGSIYIANTIELLEDKIELVLEVYDKLIKPHL